MHTHARKAPLPGGRAQRGSIIVYLVLGLVVFGVLALAGASRFGSTVMSILSPNCATSARLMAESGVRYAMARLRACSDDTCVTSNATAMNGATFTVDAAKGLSFTLAVTYDSSSGTATVGATGRSCSGLTPVTAAQSQSVSLSSIIDFSNVDKDYYKTNSLKGTQPIVTSNTTKTIAFGTIGETDNADAIWYGSNATGCVDGNCTMTYGFRSYFDIQWDRHTDSADGLVFGIISAETNRITALGGKQGMGELMGWAGPGLSGYGIRAPKIGLEFDAYDNGCGSTTSSAGSRCDANNRDHLANVFWGAVSDIYDDNRHSAGSGSSSEPVALKDPDGKGSGRFGYYYQSAEKWLTGDSVSTTKYYIRQELSRLSKTNASSDYPYVLKTWVKSAAGNTAYSNVLANYTDESPTMQRVVHLNSTYHAQLGHVFFGWTEATGSATQKLTVSNFKLSFKKAEDTLSVPQDFVSYWNMNETSGATVVNANATMPGAIQGTESRSTPANWSYGKALSFSGNNQRVKVNDATAIDLTSKGSIAAWIYPTDVSASSFGGIVHKGVLSNETDESYALALYQGRIYFLSRWANDYWSWGGWVYPYITVNTSALTAANTWYHVAVVWDANVIAIYLNGMLNNYMTNPTDSELPRNTGGALMIGSMFNENPYYGFSGLIDEVYLYNRVLTASEIAAMSLKTP